MRGAIKENNDTVSYKAKQTRRVGPLVVVPMNGTYRIIDQGNGNIVIPTRFKTRQAAQRWIDRKTQTDNL